MFTRRRILSAGLCASIPAWPRLAGAAGAYPAHPINLVVPYPPGGGTDGLARILAKSLGQQLQASIVVENLGGAGGMIGTAKVARSTPDGYTVMLGTVATHSIAPELYARMQYDAVKDFTPVANFAYLTNFIVVGPALNVGSVQELIARAKAEPGRISFASAGNGSPAHLAIELFQQRTGTKLLHVPFQGGAPAVADVLGGHVDAIFGDPVSVTPLLRTGKLRALAIAGPNRSPDFPNVPTSAEAGLPDFYVRAWHGLLAPAGTPAPIVEQLAAAVGRADQDPDVVKIMAGLGAEPASERTNDFAKMIAAERAKWGAVIQRGHISIN